MGLINVEPVNNDDVLDPPFFNERFAEIVDEINGNLDADNFADNSVPTSKLVNGAVTNEKIAAQQGFIAPTLLNSWSDYDGTTHQNAGYMKDAFGFVHLRGLIKNTNTGIVTSVAFVLPAGYRPNKVEHFPLANGNSSHSGHVRVDNGTGEVSINGAGSWSSLAGITFKAA